MVASHRRLHLFHLLVRFLYACYSPYSLYYLVPPGIALYRTPCCYREENNSFRHHLRHLHCLMFVANMRLVPATYATAILCGVLSIVVASPIRNFLNHFRRISSPPIFEDFDRRDSINCTDLGADFFEECWTLLGLTDYLQDPVTGWNVTTPVCSNTEDGTDQDGSNCCKEGVPWSTCYLHLAHGFAGDDCSTINTGSCSYDATMAVDPSIAPKVRYVMRNIYGDTRLLRIDWISADC